MASNSFPSTWRKKPKISNAFIRYGILVAVIAYLVIAGSGIDVDVERISRGTQRMGKLFSGFFHPDFVSRYKYIVVGILESLAMTAAASVVSVFLAIPLALGASRNLVPRWVYILCRLFLMLIRSLHVVVLSILFVVMFGYGPLAGVITLMLNGIGFIGKLLAEDIENINKEEIEAVRSTGANWFQTVVYGVWPQISTRFIGLSIYRADISFRQSTVIGIVGAGGIGAVLDTAMSGYDYNTAGAILLIIIIMVLITEYLSGAVRRRIL